MASDFSNLNFAGKWDVAKWKAKCEEQRQIALKWPAYNPAMIRCEDYQWELGPWRIVFCLEVWARPMWTASISIQEQVGYRTEVIENGMYAGATVEVPQDAFLAVASWVPEHFEQARYILAEVFGPILRPSDKHQSALETTGLFTMQWRVPYEGVRYWKRSQH